jgi:hypothetical protein
VKSTAVSDQANRQLDLINIKFGACMRSVEKCDLLDQVVLVVVENLNVKIAYKVQVDLIAIVANTHYKRTPFVENLDLFVE